MSFSNDIKIIALGSIGSEVATLIGRYQREGGQRMSLSEEERNVLNKAIRFVVNIKNGYIGVMEIDKFTMNSEASFSYNYYLRVRQQLPELGSLNNASEIREEIEMFADILKKINEERTLSKIGKNKLEKVNIFFSKLSDFVLQELYIINNEKSE